MAADASNKTPIPIPEHVEGWSRARGSARARVPARPFRPGPATIAVAALLCLLIGLLYLALQIRTVFSDQLKQEYAGLVLEAAEHAESAREQLGVWQSMPRAAANDAALTAGYNAARAEFARRFASFAALVNASPSPAPHIPDAASPSADAHPAASASASAAALLDNVSAYWRAQRDAYSADVRLRVTRVAYTLIALAALLFCMLITALGMYAKRDRQLAGQSHEFEHASLHDSLTGLPNRRKLLAALDEAALGANAESVAHRIAVLYIDLDGFKQVNDSFGHRTGDEFLVAVSARFRASVRRTDLVARIGGDEFAVLVRSFSSEPELADIARRLIGCVTHTDEQMAIGLVRASIGIASFPDDVDDHSRLVAVADEAMYRVKRSGKNGFAFATQMERAAAKRTA
ncbi:GGDEF domain-containing protein [Paraburkholderia susongensis]|uniref:Diguanylate cyclase (GGDEF) domain-containing protein n=1 Tax=Paraburkholderia susongensis TaxID=1515439 RepID=A0A1X7LQP8_9BURK|nr:GGDEF domain-containing protein [Paraburkholderia susongensis]SMG56236.1 diguanylate cyclase (GGDEF) domain-containing protein [Paraburkholderia susongensis]